MLRNADRHVARIARVLAFVVSCAAPIPAAGQDVSWSGTLDAAGDHLYLGFIEPAVRFGREGALQPILSLGAYVARVEGDNSVGLAPAAAVRYGGPWGSVEGKLGWGRSSSAVVGAGTPTMMMMSRVGGPAALQLTGPSLTSGTTIANELAEGDNGGLVTSVQTDFGGEGAWSLEGIGSYSWGPHVLWSRGRVTRVVSMANSGASVALGAEVVWQKQTDDQDPFQDNEYRAGYVGPVLRVTRADGATWTLSGGVKQFRPLDDTTWYAKLELTLDP